MSKKEERITKFNELQNLVNSGIYDDLLWSKTEVINPGDIKCINQIPKNINVEIANENVINTMEKYSKAAVLVFCSAKNPGGGVTNGSIAQEEEISLHSSWYFQVKDVNGFYLKTKDSAVNTDKILYIESGYLLKNEYGDDIEPINISFIGATAVNLNGMINQQTIINEQKIEQIMSHRIENILKIAQLHQKQNLILGAFGCGVFGLKPQIIAKLFKTKINEGWYHGNVIFSILDPQICDIFKNEFTTNLKLNNKPKI